jgi:tetratricopeptide (TPR) repeat protein
VNHLFRPVFLLVCLCIPADASNFAVVIGIARYGDRLGLGSEGELWYAEKDAQELYAILLSKEGGAYPPENVRKLIGADATLAHLRDALETWLPAKASNPNDRVLIFFSGHGVLENGRGYVLPFDADRRDLPKSSYSMDDLRNVLRVRVKGRTKILLTDACHSGYVNTAAASASKTLTGLDDSIFSLAAAEGVSIEQPMPGMRHGVFGTFLLQGLKGWADSNCNGIVTAQELATYIQDRVAKQTAGRQKSTYQLSSQGPDMVLAQVGTPRCRGGANRYGNLQVAVTGVDPSKPAVLVFDGNPEGDISNVKPFSLPGLFEGAHDVRIFGKGLAPAGQTANVKPDADATLSIRMAAAPARPPDVERLLQKEWKTYQDGGYQQALDPLQKAVTRVPNDAEIRYRIGLVNRALNHPDDAVKSYLEAMRLDPSFTDARLQYAGLLLDPGRSDPAEAIRQLLVLRDGLANDSRAYLILSLAYQRASLCTESVQAGAKAVLLNPEPGSQPPEAYFELAESQRLCKNYENAVDAYKEYLRLSDFQTTAADEFNYWVLGSFFGIGRKYLPARRDQWEKFRLDAYLGMCECQIGGGHACDALQSCEQALKLKATEPYGFYFSGMAGVYQAEKALTCAGKPPDWKAPCASFRQALRNNLPPAEAAKSRKWMDVIDRKLSSEGGCKP